MSDDFGSGNYLARTGQMGFRPGANIGAGGNDPVSNFFPEGSPVLGLLFPAFGKTSNYTLSTVKMDASKGVDVLIQPAPKQSPVFGSPWQNSTLAQSLRSVQDILKSTATVEQVHGVTPPGRQDSREEELSR